MFCREPHTKAVKRKVNIVEESDNAIARRSS